MKDVKRAVYVIEQNGLYKVGMSANPAGRMNDLELGLPNVHLVYTSEYVYNAGTVERYVHRKLAGYVAGREWFTGLPPEKIISVVDDAVLEVGVYEPENTVPSDRIINARIQRLLRADTKDAGDGSSAEATCAEYGYPPVKEHMVIDGVEYQVCTSVDLAGELGVGHKNVLKTFRILKCSDRFRKANFVETSYPDTYGRFQPLLIMNRRGLMALLIGCPSEKGALMREMLIELL